jgi:hypothetical protein
MGVIVFIGGIGLIVSSIFTVVHLVEEWNDDIWSAKTFLLFMVWSFFFALTVLGASYAKPNTKSAMLMAREQYEQCISYGPDPEGTKDRHKSCLQRADDYYRTLTLEGRKGLTVNKKDVTNSNEK